MKLFVSWSGIASRKIAGVMSDELKEVLPFVDPWFSARDMAPGLWRNQLFDALAETRYGIACIFPDNHESPWILFEMGVIAGRTHSEHKIAPILFANNDIGKIIPPIKDFQIYGRNKHDFTKVVLDIYRASGKRKPKKVEVLGNFDRRWNSWQTKMRKIEKDYLNGVYTLPAQKPTSPSTSVFVPDKTQTAILLVLSYLTVPGQPDIFVKPLNLPVAFIKMKMKELAQHGFAEYYYVRLRSGPRIIRRWGYRIKDLGLKHLEHEGLLK